MVYDSCMPKEEKGLKTLKAGRVNFHLEDEETEKLLALYYKVSEKHYLTLTSFFKELVGLVKNPKAIKDSDRESLSGKVLPPSESQQAARPTIRPKMRARDE